MGTTFNEDDMLCYCPRRSLRTTACPLPDNGAQPVVEVDDGGTVHTGEAQAAGCVDTQTDADHCGSCEVVCDPTAECNPTQLVPALNAAGDCPAGSLRNTAKSMCYAGACNATPTVVVPASTGCGSLHLALVDGVLFWTDTEHGTVQSLAAGGTPTTIASNQMAPTFIQVVGNDVYWLDSGNNEIMTASAAGGAATALVSVPVQLDAGVALDAGMSQSTGIGGFFVAPDGSKLYFSSGMAVNEIVIANPATITEVGRYDSGVPKALAVEGDLLGFAAADGTLQLMTLAAGDPAVCASVGSTAVNHNCTRIASAAGVNLENVFISNGVFYWVNYGQVLSSSPENRMTGVFDTVVGVTPPAMKIMDLTIEGDTVYFADNTGLVVKAPLGDEVTVTKLARGQVDAAATPPAGVSSVVANATDVYWANPACEILSLPVTTGDAL
jgi:hypothetical protein